MRRLGRPPGATTRRSLPSGPHVSEQGSASVAVVCVAIVLVGLGCVAVTLGEVVAHRAAASSAADLAALAAADQWDMGAASACEAARRVAGLNGASLRGCRRDGPDVEVDVQVPAPRAVRQLARLLGRSAPKLRVSARAGPSGLGDPNQ